MFRLDRELHSDAGMSRLNGAEGGFGLLEVLIAIVLLATTVAGLAALFTIAALSNQVARGQTLATLLATDKLEQLRALTWSFDASGAPVSDMTSDVSTEPVGSFGQGLRTSPPDALQRNAAGYVDYLDQTGRWVGTGPAAGRLSRLREALEHPAAAGGPGQYVGPAGTRDPGCRQFAHRTARCCAASGRCAADFRQNEKGFLRCVSTRVFP